MEMSNLLDILIFVIIAGGGWYINQLTSKTGTVVRTPSHGTVGSYNSSNDTFTYTPNTGYTGNDLFTFTMSDGENSSEEKTVKITVI